MRCAEGAPHAIVGSAVRTGRLGTQRLQAPWSAQRNLPISRIGIAKAQQLGGIKNRDLKVCLGRGPTRGCLRQIFLSLERHRGRRSSHRK